MMKVLWWKENLHYGCRCRVLRSLADIYSSNLSPFLPGSGDQGTAGDATHTNVILAYFSVLAVSTQMHENTFHPRF